MIKKIAVLAVFMIFSLTSCNNAGVPSEDEIKIPIYETGQKTFNASNTVKAEIMNLSETQAVPASVGYFYAEEIRFPAEDANLLEWNVAVNGKFAEGEILAVMDSSKLTYDYNNQKILVDSAEQRYIASGKETDRLEYLILKKELERLTEIISDYTITAPYDCIVVSAERFNTGDIVQKDRILFSIARSDDVYIYCEKDVSLFRLGSDVTVRLSNTDYYGKVVSCPASIPSDSSREMKNTAVVKLNDGELERFLTDTPNAVTAGWATVYITTSEKYNVLAVPDSAVRNYNGRTYCNVVYDNEAVQIDIETGQSVNGFTVIMSGLDKDDIIA